MEQKESEIEEVQVQCETASNFETPKVNRARATIRRMWSNDNNRADGMEVQTQYAELTRSPLLKMAEAQLSRNNIKK